MSEFAIAAAQVASLPGDIERNVSTHANAIAEAAGRGVSAIVFPELSLTGYEPDLAPELAIDSADSRLDPLRALARRHRMAVLVGAPLRNGALKPGLGAILFTSDDAPRHYLKMHLGSGEGPWFEPGAAPLLFTSHDQAIGVAICADASQPSHPQAYADTGASIYAAGVFLNAEWYETDMPRLAGYAAQHRFLVVMANHAASAGTYASMGRSDVWGPDGEPLAQAKGAEACLVIAARRDGAWRGEVALLGKPEDRGGAGANR
jgi:predicted amidohydrolase